MNGDKMAQNLAYVKKNQDKFLNIYLNKYILVHEEEAVGSFDSYEAAAEKGVMDYGVSGDFLVYYVTETAPLNFLATAL